jgi:hypothetical protein
MKRAFAVCVLLFYALACIVAVAQETPEDGETVRKVIEKAEEHYKKGVALTIANKPSEAKREFDAAVDTILESGLEVKKYKYLDEYYSALVEKVYDRETRTTQEFAPSHALSLTPEDRPTEAQGCRLEGKEKVALRGFRLGQTLSEVKQRFPRLALPPANRYGFTRSLITSVLPPNDVSFKDVRLFVFEFVDNKVSALRVLYRNTTDWPSADEFVNQVAKSLGIHGTWQAYSSADDEYRQASKLWYINCGDSKFMAGFAEIADKRYLYVTWEDIAADKLLYRRVVAEAERKRKEAEMRRRTFKP